MRTEFTPSIYVSEDYRDNYNQTDKNREEEFFSTYGVNFLIGFVGKTQRIYLNYNPLYKDYDKHDEDDVFENDLKLYGDIELSRRAVINFDMGYDDHENTDNGISDDKAWEHHASVSGKFQVARHTGLTMEERYTESFDRDQRTGILKEHETNTTSVGITHEFGIMNSFGLNCEYSFDNYDQSDADEYKGYSPSAFFAFWFTPRLGIDSNFSFEEKNFDISRDEETYSGDLRLIRKISRHLQAYIKYKHTVTEKENLDSVVYNPSLGLDWDITEDSGFSLGLGYLIQEWEESTDRGVFVDADIFKTFDFSRRGMLTLSGASGYDASGDDNASLGFTVYYQAGFLFAWQLTKMSSLDLTGSWIRDEYDEPGVDRVDNTLDLGAALSWAPLRWMNFSLSYEFKNYDTDSDRREGYHENRGTITISLYPLKPLVLDETSSREDIEKRIFKN
ncbi:MAG: hypothetical protein GY737_18395 [Desulfobacteraceae bacterium]|nr:hypothetical protein [Desulfobacteraceae bacterium]